MNRRLDNDRTIRAPHGPEISAKSWLTEAPLRMLMNNLDPDVAERPSELVVYGGSLAGKWILTAGLGGMGGAQPLAATMAGASMLAIECQPSRIEMRLRTGYLDRQASTLDEALSIMAQAAESKQPVSVGLLGNAADIFPELVRRGVRPDIVTDQTSAHDPINGYQPKGWTLAEWEARRNADPKAVEAAAKTSMVSHVQDMLDFHAQRVPTLHYGNNIRQMAKDMGLKNA